MSARSSRVLIAIFVLLLGATGVSAAPSPAAGEVTMTAQSTDVPAGRKTFVLLSWSEAEDAEGYNLYRKTNSRDTYPSRAINAEPIRLMTDCEAIRAMLGDRSQELRALSLIRLPGKKDDLRGIPDIGDRLVSREFDPCRAVTQARGTDAWEQVQFYARLYHMIALVIGQAYIDSTATSGTEYWYELRAVSRGRESTLVTDLHVVAGRAVPLPAPANVRAVAGDSRVMVTWDPVDNSTGYDVFRKNLPGGTVVKVNDAPVVSMVTHNLDGDSIPPVFGLVDYRRWDDATGMPLTHDVGGVAVDGPANGTSYQYQVSAINSLDQPGDRSSFTSTVTPADRTPPGLPGDLGVEPVGQTLVVTWTRVEKDQYGRVELDGISGYNIYRSESQSDMSPVKINAALIPQPGTGRVQYIDSDPAIRSEFGEKEFYYRIRCIDSHSNTSVLSSAAGGHVPDITPPAVPKGVDAEGHAHYIRIVWDPNTEPDIESYAIFRSLCHRGEWLPPEHAQKRGVDCGPFAMLAEITHEEALDSARVHGKAVFHDLTVPNGSPLCYAYWVKARDHSQNLSGTWPYPNSTERAGIVCMRLRDETPPPPPVCTAMRALSGEVHLEWIAAPSQDIHAFHVYRAEEESGEYRWIGGVTVEEPPTPPALLSAPYEPAAPAGCDEIPLVPHEGMNAGSFSDKGAAPKIVYWYKVASVDKDGNENKLAESVPYSTFTFKEYGPEAPEIISIKELEEECGLEISWIPDYDAALHLGFVVFRSPTETGVYRQISAILVEQPYVDTAINRGVTYWYKIQAFDIDGRPSKISPARMGRYD